MNSFTLDNLLLCVSANFSLEEKSLTSKDVVIIVLLVLIAVILVVTGTYVCKYSLDKQKPRKSN